MRRRALIIVTILAGIMAFPFLVEAAEKVHWFQCGDCHRSGLTPWQVSGVCSRCHPKDPTNWGKIAAGSPTPVSTLAPGNFDINDASNAFGSHPSYNAVSARETSHYWASTTDSMPQAGALPPLNPAFDATKVSKGKVTCSRCHDPHAFDSNLKMTKMDNSRDQMCLDCHRSWNQSNNSGLETHPLVADFDAALSSSPSIDPTITYNSVTGVLDTNVNQGALRVLYNSASGKFMLSCTSCHGVHFTDSDSTTADGLANQGGLGRGDGKLLRTDGRSKNASAICQACHVYKTHGNVDYEPSYDLDAIDEQVGCLDCHSGHSYNPANPQKPNYFVLRPTVNTGSFGTKTTLYNSLTTPWEGITNPWEGYCTSCHGPVNLYPAPPTGRRAHTSGENCKGCHAHDANGYSFNMGDNATICGDCHGAPPRDNATTVVRSDTNLDPPSYAVGPNAGTGDDYIGDADYKDETRTPHKIHAGALNADKAVVDYAFGLTSGGTASACIPCHNDMTDTGTPTHDTGTSTGSYRDIYFSPFATYNGVITGQAYPTSGGSAWKCSNVYCHSNGGKRRDTGTKVAADFKTTQTNPWLDGSVSPNAIVGTGTECQQCHGENIATMANGAAASQKSNSQTHNRHLTKLGDDKTTCYLCHSSTVDATGAVPAAARDIRAGGTHVNGSVEVVFNRPTALYNTLSTGTYTGGNQGTCLVYCHDPEAGDTAGGTVDWDNYTGLPLACDACHGGLTTDVKPMSTGAHSRHIATGGANIGCDTCHGPGASAGTHTGHVDGQVTRYTDAATCDVCHGVENTAAWDVTPIWTLPSSIDCRTCHTGALRTSYSDATTPTPVVRTAPDKSNFSAQGHGKAGVARVCNDCHIDNSASMPTAHADGTGNNTNMLLTLNSQVYGTGTDNNANLWCQECHAGHYVHYDNGRTGGGSSFDGNRCNLCHNPHGQVGVTLGAMLAGTINGKTVAAYVNGAARSDFYVPTPGATYGICQVCHDAAEVPYFNTTQAAATTHMDPDLCTTCHVHTDNPGFQFSATGCESCHGPGKTRDVRANGAHTVHIGATSFDLDKTDCALCHANADAYTTSLSNPSTPTHGNAGVDVLAGLGYSLVSQKYTCTTNTCHASSSTDGYWKDTAAGNAPDAALNCNACHGGANADGRPNVSNHNKHVLAGMTCAGCHTNIDQPGDPLTHLTVNAASTTDSLKLQDKAQAMADEAAVNDDTFTENVTSTFADGGNTCSNTYCHDPSNTGRTAAWDSDSSTGNCALCHGYDTTMASGSHGGHVNNASIYGSNIACTACHPNNAANTHFITSTSPFTTRNQVVVAGTRITTEYTGEKALPSTGVGTCGTNACHENPIDGSAPARTSYTWGVTSLADDCASCHVAPPATGDHAGHYVTARTDLGLTCRSCHGVTAANNTSILASNSHLNNSTNVDQGGLFDGSSVALSYTGGSPATCSSVSCHNVGTSYSWQDVSSCEGCHASGGQKPMTSQGAHPAHINITTSIDDDKSDCAQCHPGALTIDGSVFGQHRDGTVQTTFTVTISGTKTICASNNCHASSETDGFWKDSAAGNAPDSNGLDCSACHGNPPAGTNHSKHITAGLACADCHGTVNTAGTKFPNLDHKQAKDSTNQGTKLLTQGKDYLNPNGTVVNIVVANWTNGAALVANDGINTCANVACHNPSPAAAYSADWDGDTDAGTCDLCHSATNPNTGSHNAHLNASALYGRNATCGDCHPTNSSNTHRTGAVDLNAGFAYSASLSDFTSGTWGKCTTLNCHQNGKGTEVQTPTNWGTAAPTACGTCHAASPTASGSHNAHLGSVAYGPHPSGSTDCGECHLANTDNGSMANRSTHFNGTISFPGPIEVASGAMATDTSVTTCSNCHGGLTAANAAGGAKKSWASPPAGGLECESCHGDFGTANTKADNNGVAAPVRASTAFDSYGHGKIATPHATYGGKLCKDCHNRTTQHFNAGDVNRLKTVASNDFDNVAETNAFCNACHPVGKQMYGHFDNSQTPLGASVDGLYCSVCHDPHGQNGGMDTMVKSSIGGRTVDGFLNKATQANYYLDPPNSGANLGKWGICQVCHDNNNGPEVPWFNWTTATSGHQGGDVCTTCHQHTANPAFKKSGCAGCHGNGTTKFWPDGSNGNPTYVDDNATVAANHNAHVGAIAQKKYGETIAVLLTDTGNGTSSDKQKAVCAYCHPNPGASGHDTNATPSNRVDVNNADTDGDGTPDAPGRLLKIVDGVQDDYGFFRTTSTDKTCSNVACHASAPYTPGWWGDTVPPAAVTGLAATDNASRTDPEPGTVELTWIAPGDDNGDDGTAYMYDVRYSTSAISSDAAFNSASRAGGPPTVDRRSKQQTMTVKGLTPGTNYYFAVKTRDEVATNWSPLDLAYTSTPRQAQPDNLKPIFWGLDKAVAVDTTGAVNLSWEAARDHTLPIDYYVYYGTAPTTYSSQQAITRSLNYRVTDLTPGIIYYFAVRAKDGAGNPVETNTLELQTMPAKAEELPWADKTYYASGANVPPVNMVTGNYPGTTNTMALPATFAISSNYLNQTNVLAGTFAIYVDNGNTASAGITATLGYWNGSFVSLGQTASSGTIAARARRVVKFAFNNARVTVPANNKLAIQITGSGIDSVGWGDSSYRGDIQVREQKYNSLPTAPTITAPSASTLSGAVDIAWNASTDANGDAIHYDVYASCTENAVTTPYVIATGLTTTSTTWDTQGDGIALETNTASCTITVESGDGKATGAGTGAAHNPTVTTAKTVDNRTDTTPPAAVAELVAETRPKQGSAFLTWTSVGDDGTNHGSRATQYDIRYSVNPIVTSGDFLAASELYGEPVPDFSGTPQSFEALGMGVDTAYYFAIAVGDETTIGKTYGTDPGVNGNWSPITATVASKHTGPKCGICHSTPPDENATAGKHSKHGYTMKECGNCHTFAAETFTTDHQDGVISLGFKTATPATTTVGVGTITYYQGGTKIYEDTNGVGGFNASGGTQVDNGSCFNFSTLGISGCHGPATPNWDTATPSLACSACHGTLGRVNDPYGRPYDDTSEDILASPPKDNHGYDGLPTDPIEKRKFVGQHEKHLNFSFRFAKGDSCRLCHLNAVHYDGNVQVELDKVAAGKDTAQWTAGADASTPGTCSGTGATACHNGSGAIPTWDSNENIGCNNCHDMENKAYTVGGAYGSSEIPHVYLTVGGTVADCVACHVEGHPQGADGDTSTFMIPNNMSVGIDYRSDGIHLNKTIASRGPFNTEAEICWGCHNAVGVSEWGTNKGSDFLDDLGQRQTGYTSPYNYGGLEGTANWVGAIWKSAYGQSSGDPFYYKRGKIQSTHSTNPTGTAKVTWSSTNGRYDETLDAVDKIRCSNCHDVHDLNKAAGDVALGGSLLRGTWRGNPYEEDGAPFGTMSRYTAVQLFGAVPRGSVGYKQLGGYYIDQNNVTPGTGNTTRTNAANPTSGWTPENSAGLCFLCHSSIDSMDQVVDGNLWIGVNGHSNAVIGGTGLNKANIFDFTHGRPTPVGDGAGFDALDVPGMGYVNYFVDYGVKGVRGYGYRGDQTAKINTSLTPSAGYQAFPYMYYDWGATVDAGTLDPMYHSFSCSKCHNPHASRLPKLMITNCLDSRHNTWDNAIQTQSWWTNTADNGRQLAFWTSAQNCHRYDDQRAASATRGPVTTISFQVGTGTGGTDRILDSGNGLGVFTVGENILVSGSTSNNRHFRVLARPSNGIIEVAAGSVTAEAAGSSITITNPKLKGGWNVVTPWVRENINNTVHQ